MAGRSKADGAGVVAFGLILRYTGYQSAVPFAGIYMGPATGESVVSTICQRWVLPKILLYLNLLDN